MADYYEVRSDSHTSFGSGQVQTTSGGVTSHTRAEGQRTDVETHGPARSTKTVQANERTKSSRRTNWPVTVTKDETVREHRVRTNDVADASVERKEAYLHDGFHFEFELEFPNQTPRNLETGADFLVC